MSTMGRGVDLIAECNRRHERRLAKRAISLGQAVDFAIATLSDPTLPAAQACAVALTALTLDFTND
jgi:hypothetical protein